MVGEGEMNRFFEFTKQTTLTQLAFARRSE